MEESKYMSSKANFEIAEQNSDLFYQTLIYTKKQNNLKILKYEAHEQIK